MIIDDFDCLIVPMTSGFRGGQDQIMVFQRYCHGDVSMTTNISILNVESLPRGPGNVLVIDNPRATRREDFPIAIAHFRGDSGIEALFPVDARVVSLDSLVAGYHVRFSISGDAMRRDSARTVFSDSVLFKQMCTQADSGLPISSYRRCTPRDQRFGLH